VCSWNARFTTRVVYIGDNDSHAHIFCYNAVRCSVLQCVVCCSAAMCCSVFVNLRFTTGWRRLIGSSKLQIIFHTRATKYRSLFQKMTYKGQGSYESSPPCTRVWIWVTRTHILTQWDSHSLSFFLSLSVTHTHTHTHTRTHTHTHTHTHAHTHTHTHTHTQTHTHAHTHTWCLKTLVPHCERRNPVSLHHTLALKVAGPIGPSHGSHGTGLRCESVYLSHFSLPNLPINTVEIL